MPSSNRPSDVIKPKAKERIHTATMSLYIPQNVQYINKRYPVEATCKGGNGLSVSITTVEFL
jgi:hypothetical protein